MRGRCVCVLCVCWRKERDCRESEREWRERASEREIEREREREGEREEVPMP